MMSKKSIVAILMMIFSFSIISIYSTYAFNNEVLQLNESESDYNLIYSISENSNRQITVNSNETKYVDISLTNTYDSTIRYGMYYYAVNPEYLPSGVTISLADNSEDPLQNIIRSKETKSVSIMVKNESEYNIVLILGALVGFENGDIKDLETNKQILIK